ncbi:MAG: hypothetical protein LAT65_06170 [Saccharospirillum sp.]|nr:hypothetical protein [Saccharospirillum sp.]
MQNQKQKLQQLLAENAIGTEEFAYCLGIEPAQAEALTEGRKKITARLARQIEQTFSKPAHWLDDDVQSSASDHDLFG